MNIASRILFIEIVNILRKTKNNPNQPRIIATESKLEPKSRCNKFCMNVKINSSHSTLIRYIFNKARNQFYDIFLDTCYKKDSID